MKTILEVQLDSFYGKRQVLSEIRFDLCQGEVLGLVGGSGAGKSSLVLSLLGLLPWRGGSARGAVMLDGQNLLTLPEREMRGLRGRRISLVPQSPLSALNGALSLKAHFEEAWKAHSKAGLSVLWQRLEVLFGQVQLPSGPEFLRRKPAQISVGQAQRILITMALLHEPALIIADEPTSALDPVTQIQIVELLKRVNRQQGTTMLYVSHDLVSVIKVCDRVAVMDSGSIVEILPVEELGRAKHPATRSLLASLPVPPDVLMRYRHTDAGDESLSYAHCPGLMSHQ